MTSRKSAKSAPAAASDEPPVIDHAAVVADYIAGVTGGTIPVGRLVRRCVERHLEDLERWGTAADEGNPAFNGRPYYFDEEAALIPLVFICLLKHWKGKWARKWFIPNPWQAFIIWVLFGWQRADTHTRRFTVAYIEVPRKNGKSTLLAGILLYMLMSDGEEGAEVYSAATKKDQARIIFDCAKNMLKASPDLRGDAEIVKLNISVPLTHSKFEPLSSDENGMDGLNPHAAGIDELHAHRTRTVYELIDTGTGAREQPLLIAITTAGVERNSVCYEQRQHSENILDPRSDVSDEEFFAFVSTIDDDDDWSTPEAWAKANPNFGESVNPHKLEKDAARALAIPGRRNGFKRLHLNVWTDQAEIWIAPESWDACAWMVDGKPVPVHEPDLAGCQCHAAIDLAAVRDTASLTLNFPLDLPDGRIGHALIQRFWLPEGALHNEDFTVQKREMLRRWADAGYLTLTPGEVTDQQFIRREINQLAEAFEFINIGIDPFNAQQLRLQLEQDGHEVIHVRQTFLGLNSFCKSFETSVINGLIDHGGHPMLRHHVLSTVVVEDPAGNIRPDKKKSEFSIDGCVTTIMAHGLATVTEADPPSVYEERGALVL